MERYDIAIIGTGPAGLEAAITARARNKNVLLLGSKNLSTKIEKAHTIQNYLGLSEVSGEKMQQAFLDHIVKMGIEITEDKATVVYSMGEYFAIQGQGIMYEAKTVILACGTSVVKPIAGELEHLGRGVSYCATCDAALYRDRTAIVLSYSKKEEKEAIFLSELAKKVYYVAMYPTDLLDTEKLEVVKAQRIKEIVKNTDDMELVMEQGSLHADGIFILREHVAPSQLVPGLRIENHQVAVDRHMKTNIDGLFACGDITGAPYQYIKAAGEGNVAALSAVDYLAEHFV